ncbi:hypothetical protein [Roseimicrobium sp. ORNL1]|uniref:hypothetical protein n=1 Tax=Roseimicrobium sp. ORNL1 TaxID=2711231 RepID=UPI0013E1A091|nr:hypothetical protein [Roseimicrobium sp. ORNL1]QIF02571.1 hypothetical protein G5S37_13905 [Roseimicrobium sp. ORNL1]
MSSAIQGIKRLLSGCMSVLAMVVAILMLGSLVIPFLSITREKDKRLTGISNCRLILTAMRIYSSDHDGKYPDAELSDPRTSNEVFRVLFQETILDNELIFGCPLSPFVPDGNIGATPDCKQALEAGENHWAMTRGVSDRDPGSIPLVYENPAVATWSPKWNVDARETETRGRAWRLGHRSSPSGVIVGLNDSSVSMQPLDSDTGVEVPLKKVDGRDLFEASIEPATFPKGEILDIQVPQ